MVVDFLANFWVTTYNDDRDEELSEFLELVDELCHNCLSMGGCMV